MDFHDFYDLFSAETWARYFKTPRRIAEEFVHFDGPRSVLEVGTAEAYVIRTLVKEGVLETASGYDISEKRLGQARRRVEIDGLAGRISLCLGDGQSLPFGDGGFDVTLLPQILEHVPTREGVADLLQEARRVAAQGVLVSLPLRDTSSFLMRWSKYLDPDHIRGLVRYKNHWIYDADEVETLFDEVGLQYERSASNNEFYRLW